MKKNRLILLMFFVKVLSSLKTTNYKVIKIKEGYVKEIDKEAVAPYTLIDHSSCCCLASYNINNRDCLTTV
jgi:predicted transcriptional regulator